MRCPSCPTRPGIACPGEGKAHLCARAARGEPEFRAALARLADREAAARADDMPGAPAAGPSLARKAVNFGRAVASHVAAGMPTVDDAEHARRLGICRGCEQFEAERVACKLCGCNLEVKARWAGQDCPAGKWRAASLDAPRPDGDSWIVV